VLWDFEDLIVVNEIIAKGTGGGEESGIVKV
jgi:hypothetical protein